MAPVASQLLIDYGGEQGEDWHSGRHNLDESSHCQTGCVLYRYQTSQIYFRLNRFPSVVKGE